MSSFKIDLKTVEELRSKHSQLSSRLSSAANQLSSAAYGVDPAIKSRRQLHYRLSYATQRLRGLEDRMYNISDFMRKAIEQYESTEGQIKSKVGEITGRHRRSWLESLFDGVGDAYNALTQWLASEDGKRFTEQAKANAIAPANSCPAPEEPIDYRQYIGEYDRDTPGVDGLYFIDADGKRVQVDYSKLEQLVGEYYFVSNLQLIPGHVLYLTEDNYTDFYRYAIKQGYDPRTFQPIDVAEEENIQNYIIGRIQTHEMYRQKQKVIGSLMLDLTPVIGQIKSAIELWKGENLVTGEELNGWDYGFGAVGAIAPAIKGGRGLYKGYKALTAVDEVADVGRVINSSKSIKGIKSWDEINDLLKNEGVDQAKIDEILNTPKGSRPDPSTYLSETYIRNHLIYFQDGVTKIKAKPPIDIEGVGLGTFVMPKSVADEVISRAEGDVTKLEELLGLNPGDLGLFPVRVDIPNPQNIRIPSGNEAGAWPGYWTPGGYTKPGGVIEAVIDPVPKSGYIVKENIFGK